MFGSHAQREGPDHELVGQGKENGGLSGTRINLPFFLIFSKEHKRCFYLGEKKWYF